MSDINFHELFPQDPNKETITENMHLEKEWFAQAENVKTIDELSSFVSHMLNDYNHDYGTCCHAIAACAVASAWLGSHVEGITGFQAGAIMWGFIRHWTKTNNKCGMRLVDYDEFLYPQYAYKFEKTIDKDTWECIQKEAKRNLEKEDRANAVVRQHWQDIVDGVVPFGYRVSDGLPF